MSWEQAHDAHVRHLAHAEALTPEQQQVLCDAELESRKRELDTEQDRMATGFGEAGWRSPFYTGTGFALGRNGYDQEYASRYEAWQRNRDKYVKTSDPRYLEQMLSWVSFSCPPAVHEVPRTGVVEHDDPLRAWDILAGIWGVLTGRYRVLVLMAVVWVVLILWGGALSGWH